MHIHIDCYQTMSVPILTIAVSQPQTQSQLDAELSLAWSMDGALHGDWATVEAEGGKGTLIVCPVRE